MNDVLILGSSKGLGKSLYKFFETDGVKVLGVSRTEGDYTDFICDLSNKEQTNKLVETLYISEIMPKSIIFNAGQGSSKKETLEERKKELMNQNFHNSKNFIEILEKYPKRLNDFKNLIFINSICALENFDCSEEYMQSKSELLKYSRVLAKNFIKYGIRVNSILPGNIMHENSIWNKKFKDDNEEKNFLNKTMPHNDWIYPIDIYETITFLIKNKNVVNTEIILDGGQSIFSPN